MSCIFFFFLRQQKNLGFRFMQAQGSPLTSWVNYLSSLSFHIWENGNNNTPSSPGCGETTLSNYVKVHILGVQSD